MTTQNHLVFPVRRASGTFFFSAFFLCHVAALVSVLDSAPRGGTAEQVIMGIAVYALSFAVSLVSGLCLVSSVYAPHYIKIGLLISVPNVAFFFFIPHQTLESVILLIGNQAMACIYLLGGLFMSFLVPFKMVKRAKLHHQVPQTQVVIPIPPTADHSTGMCSTMTSFPETPRSNRFQHQSPPRTPVSRPVFFAEAEQEHSPTSTQTGLSFPPTQTGLSFPPPLYKHY